MIQKISATVTLLRPSHKVLLTGALVALPVLFSPAWAGSLFSGPPGNPCRGPGSLLALLNRPTVSDSSCTVAAGRVMVEGGWQRLNLYEVPGGRSVNYPEFEFSFGLPHRTEIVVLPPNFTRQTVGLAPSVTTSGYQPLTVGVRHMLVDNELWQIAAEELVTVPSGSTEDGSAGTGFATNAIMSYSLPHGFGAELQLGVSSETLPTGAGGARYTSFNPIGDLTYEWDNRYQLYSEIFGETETAPGAGEGFAWNGGFQILPLPRFELDVEIGHRISGSLGFENYVGFGGGFEF
jgi:hypothetical protein